MPSLVFMVVMGGPRRQLHFRVIASYVTAEAAQAEARSRPCVRVSRMLGMIGRRLGEARRLSPRVLNKRVVSGDCVVCKALAGIRCPRLYWRLR